MRFGLTTDFRNPPGSGKSTASVYAEIIEMFVWAETLGFDAAYVFEHHFTDDDYMPSPMVAATAIAARTKQDAHRPGYRDPASLRTRPPRRGRRGARFDFQWPSGFRRRAWLSAAGICRLLYGYRRKGSRANEALQIIRRYGRARPSPSTANTSMSKAPSFRPVRSSSQIRPSGSAVSAARLTRRAARYGDGYIGPSNRAMYEMYLAELRAAGKDPAHARVMGGDLWLIVTEDPDRTFAAYAPHLLYWFNSYSKWFEGTDTSPWPHFENSRSTARQAGSSTS